MKIAFCGDIYLDEESRQLESDLTRYLGECDYRIANLECPIVLSDNKCATKKTGPNLRGNETTIHFLKRMNINVVGLANNHICDFGYEGIEETINVLDKNGIMYVGAGANIEEAYEPLCVEHNGLTVSIIAVCENEFGMASVSQGGAAGFCINILYQRIVNERKKNHKVIVFFHGGNEFNPFPSPQARDRYRLLIDFGACAVLASHTHCPQGFEWYNNGFIAYGMGNFYFPQKRFPFDIWNMGYVCILDIDKSINVNVIPYRYSYCLNQIIDMTLSSQYLDYLNGICEPIKNDEEILKKHIQWSCLNGGPLYSKYLFGGKSDENILEIQNILRCEAHREMMVLYLENCDKEISVDYNGQNKFGELFLADIDWKKELLGNMGTIIEKLKNQDSIAWFGYTNFNMQIIGFVNKLMPNTTNIIIDNDPLKWGKIGDDIEVKSVEALYDYENIMIVITSSLHRVSMREQLLKMNISTNRILEYEE